MTFQTTSFSLQRCCQAAALLVMAGLVGLVGTPARAATASASFNVTASVATVCSVAATDLAFGTYNAAALVDTLATSAITVTCSLNTAYTMCLNHGTR